MRDKYIVKLIGVIVKLYYYPKIQVNIIRRKNNDINIVLWIFIYARILNRFQRHLSRYWWTVKLLKETTSASVAFILNSAVDQATVELKI